MPFSTVFFQSRFPVLLTSRANGGAHDPSHPLPLTFLLLPHPHYSYIPVPFLPSKPISKKCHFQPYFLSHITSLPSPYLSIQDQPVSPLLPHYSSYSSFINDFSGVVQFSLILLMHLLLPYSPFVEKDPYPRPFFRFGEKYLQGNHLRWYGSSLRSYTRTFFFVPWFYWFIVHDECLCFVHVYDPFLKMYPWTIVHPTLICKYVIV